MSTAPTFHLERFDRIDVDADHVLLRVEGRWEEGTSPKGLIRLIAARDGVLVVLRPMAGGPVWRSDVWQAGYAIASEAAEGATFSLQSGGPAPVALPAPVSRPLRATGQAAPRPRPTRSATVEAAIAAGRLSPQSKHTSIRRVAARGTLLTAGFMLALQALGALQGLVVAALIPTREYGKWGLLVVTLGTLSWLAQLGFDDKYVQQDDRDPEKAFHVAFTMQCILVVVFMGLVLVLMPIFAAAYGRWDILVPGYVLGLLAMPPTALQAPMWVYYRRMEYARGRALGSVGPVAGLIVTITLAAVGAGVWALILGTVAAGWAGSAVAIIFSPYRLRLHFERSRAREYIRFSMPLLLGSLNGILIAQIPIFFVQRQLGLAAVGAITLAGSISLYAARIDDMVGQTLFTTVAAVKDRMDLLVEAFTKTNSLAALWGVPVGVGLALFAEPLVHFLLGEKWHLAIVLLEVMAVTAGINQLGFNWVVFYRALGRTRPIAVESTIVLVATLGLTIPLVLADGLEGYAFGMAGATVIALVARMYYLRQLFPKLNLLGHMARACAPTVPAALAVLAVRWLGAPSNDATWAVGELMLFVSLVGLTTYLREGDLAKEIVGYLRRSPATA